MSTSRTKPRALVVQEGERVQRSAPDGDGDVCVEHCWTRALLQLSVETVLRDTGVAGLAVVMVVGPGERVCRLLEQPLTFRSSLQSFSRDALCWFHLVCGQVYQMAPLPKRRSKLLEMCVKEYLRLVALQRIGRHARQSVGHVVAQNLGVGRALRPCWLQWHGCPRDALPLWSLCWSRDDQFDSIVSPVARTERDGGLRETQ